MGRVTILILAVIALDCHAEGKAGLPLVFDPHTNKYFLGGNGKFNIIDRVEVSLDGGDFKRYGDAIELDQEGKHRLKFRPINTVNNWSPVQVTEVFVDLTAPTTEARLPAGTFRGESETYVALKSNITLSAQDNLSGIATIEYSWDGKDFTPYKKPIALEKPGKQTLYYRSVDLVGNRESTKQLGFVVDGSPPVSKLAPSTEGKPITVKGKPYLGFSESATFTLTAEDDLSKVKRIMVSADGAAPTPYIRPLNFLKEGPHRLTYFAEDNVGNKEEPKSVPIFTVSVPPQTVAIPTGKVVNTGGVNFATGTFELRLETKENVVGLERIEYKIDEGGAMNGYLEPIRFNTPGSHRIVFHAIDRAGNQEPLKTYAVRVLDTAPETKLRTAQPLIERDGVVFSPAPNVVILNVVRNEVGIAETMVRVDDGAWVRYTGALTLSADRKVHRIGYKSVDKLGNVEDPKMAEFHMIGTTPSVDVFISNGKSAEDQIKNGYFEGERK